MYLCIIYDGFVVTSEKKIELNEGKNEKWISILELFPQPDWHVSIVDILIYLIHLWSFIVKP